MEQILDERFNRVDVALNALIESITTANPSISATQDLIAADDSISEGLEQRKSLRLLEDSIKNLTGI